MVCLRILKDLQAKMKREHEEREVDLDDLRNQLKADKSNLDEKIIKERNALRENFDQEQLDMNKRLDKLNLDRMSDMADVQVSSVCND